MSTAKIKNTSGYPRTGIVTLGIPFTRGENLQVGDTLVVSGAVPYNSNQKIQWYPQGIRYDNGAVKYARASFRVDLDSFEEKTVTVNKSINSTAITNYLNPQLVTAFLGTVFTFSIQGNSYTIPMTNVALSLIEGGGPEDHYNRYRYFTYLPNDPLMPQYRHIWVELVVESFSNLNHIQFYFRFGYYRFEPNVLPANGVDPVLTLNYPVTLRIQNAGSKIRWEEYKIPGIQYISDTERVYTLINPFVAGRNKFPIGSSHCYKGVLIYDASNSSAAELDGPILAMSDNWKTFYPITNVMPERPSYITSDADALNRSQTLLALLENPIKSRTDPYNWPTICNNPDTAVTGTHGTRDYAFGLRGYPFMSTTDYNWIPMLEFNTRQQATRCNWFYDEFGNPVSPTQFSNIGTIMFNGTFFSSTRGYTRVLQSTDYITAMPIPQNISGPDKQHYTNKLMIIQGLITMDWFSLEFARMYSKFWIHSNRTDGNLFVASLEAPRAAGRTSEVAAFLYEFFADPELKFWIHKRQDDNLSKYDHLALNKSMYPGGIEVLRPLFRLGACNQGACLGPLEHWRPWEESQACLGFYLLSKCLLSEDPNNTRAQRMLEISRDIAGSVTLHGFKDGRSTSSRRFFTLFFPTSQACTDFYNAIGSLSNNIPLTGLTNNGSGIIYLAHSESDVGAPPDRSMRIELRDANGVFTIGETVRLRTGHTATIGRTWEFDGGAKSYSTNSPTNGYLRALSEAELLEQTTPGAEPQYPITEGGTPRFPFGGSKYTRWYYLYGPIQAAALIVAKQSAILGHYSDNTTVLAKALDLLEYYYNSEYNVDNGDYEESFISFAGYIDPSILESSVQIVSPSTVVLESIVPSPSVSITTNTVNAIINADFSTITVTTVDPTVLATSSTNAVVSAGFSTIEVNSLLGSSSAGAVVSAGYSSATFSTPVLNLLYITSNSPGIRSFLYVYIGKDSIPIVPGGPDDSESGSPTEELPPTTPFYYHRLLPLTAINLSTPITSDFEKFTDYVLTTPINQNSPYRGEITPLPGQVLRSEGYSYYIGSEADTRTDYTEYIINQPSMAHTISIDNKGASIRGWATTIEGFHTVDWLRNKTLQDGVIVSEEHTVLDGSLSKKFNPNFNGALSDTRFSFVSPPIYSRVKEFKQFTLVEAAVTPLELDGYGVLSVLQNNGGTSTSPLIARDMKQYYSFAFGKNSDLIQAESWSYHNYGIPVGNHASLSNNLNLDFVYQFDGLVLYDLRTRTSLDISFLLGTTSFKLLIGTGSIEVLVGGQTIVIPSFYSSGTVAIIAGSSTRNFVTGVCAKLNDFSENLTKTNVVTFERIFFDDYVSHGFPNSKTGDRIGISSLIDPIFNNDTIHRGSGWIGQRMYFTFASTYQAVAQKLDELFGSTAFSATVNEPGLYVYERPAII